jgi:hypothetical protein
VTPTELYAPWDVHEGFTSSTINYLLSAISDWLFSNFLKLLTDYRSVEAIDGDVKPIALFAFGDKVVGIANMSGPGRVASWLSDHVSSVHGFRGSSENDE